MAGEKQKHIGKPTGLPELPLVVVVQRAGGQEGTGTTINNGSVEATRRACAGNAVFEEIRRTEHKPEASLKSLPAEEEWKASSPRLYTSRPRHELFLCPPFQYLSSPLSQPLLHYVYTWLNAKADSGAEPTCAVGL